MSTSGYTFKVIVLVIGSILLALADSSCGPAILWCRPGVVDTTIPSNLLLYHGYAFACFGPVLRRTGLTHTLHA
jgi:hypothetical protein